MVYFGGFHEAVKELAGWVTAGRDTLTLGAVPGSTKLASAVRYPSARRASPDRPRASGTRASTAEMLTVEKAAGSTARRSEAFLEPAGAGSPARASEAMSAAPTTTVLRRMTGRSYRMAAGPVRRAP